MKIKDKTWDKLSLRERLAALYFKNRTTIFKNFSKDEVFLGCLIGAMFLGGVVYAFINR